jgi:hypothetical protein
MRAAFGSGKLPVEIEAMAGQRGKTSVDSDFALSVWCSHSPVDTDAADPTFPTVRFNVSRPIIALPGAYLPIGDSSAVSRCMSTRRFPLRFRTEVPE